MTDRELLELAAKAAGISVAEWNEIEEGYRREDGGYFRPLADSGDAFRLAVTLGIKNYFEFDLQPLGAMVTCIGDERLAIHESTERQDLYAATRRAIVRAAAEIGREMK